jgi:hypothetical protein
VSSSADRLGAGANLVLDQTLLAMLEGNAEMVEAGARLVELLVTEAELALAREQSSAE